jgi:dolichol kinase
MCVILLLLTAIFVGNPFDFKYTLQFVPYGLLTIAVLLGAYELFKNIQRFDVPVTNDGLAEFLKKTINGYEKNKKAESWFGIILFSAGILTAFSFLPQKLEHKPLWQALGETGIAVLITVLIYSIAFKLGAFKNRGSEGFKNDWNELNELKAISYELGPME